jgi:hypothetical protein
MADESAALGCLVVLAGLGAGGYWACQHFRDCPFGAEQVGKHPPDGTEEWCQEKNEAGSYIRHGHYREWYPSGQLAQEGDYEHGAKAGHWTT